MFEELWKFSPVLKIVKESYLEKGLIRKMF